MTNLEKLRNQYFLMECSRFSEGKMWDCASGNVKPTKEVETSDVWYEKHGRRRA